MGLIVGIVCCISMSQAADICEISFTGCPENFNGQTINVPLDAVALSARIRACLYSRMVDTSVAGGAPAIMFVIDNSGSMSGLGSAPNDQMGSRFTVTLALLDEIYRAAPDAQVGVAIFQNMLIFDNRDDPYFTALPGNVDGNSYQSYIPLTQLNDTLAGSILGIDKLKQLLAIDTLRGPLYNGSTGDYVALEYQATNTQLDLYTNINVGFDAARHAFSSTSIARDRRFVIFLSDGDPRGDDQAGKPADDSRNVKKRSWLSS